MSTILNKRRLIPHFSWLLVSFLLLHTDEVNASLDQDVASKKQAYIVYLGDRKHSDVDLVTESHHQFLASVLRSKEAAVDSMIYSYRHGFSGFAAKMSKSQAEYIADLPGVVQVLPNRIYKLHTSRSWDYLGLSDYSTKNLLHDTNQGDGAIIGIIDTGVWPESESFDDKGLGPIPSKWKGFCQPGDAFKPRKHCNRKLIGARYFIDGFLASFDRPLNVTESGDYLSPRDSAGHGTHCTSVAGGSFVSNVSIKGLARGTIRGGAPRARVAMYKVGWLGGSVSSADILKAFDEAIHDGVDVLSVSIGLDLPLYPETDKMDVIYYGSFHAVANGIAVVCSAGNSGPLYQTVEDVAPWVISVAASTVDRSFPTPIILGNSQAFSGLSMYVGKDTGFLGLSSSERTDIGLDPRCDTITANDTWVAGKVVVCFTLEGGENAISQAMDTVKQNGGLGLIATMKSFQALSPYYSTTFPTILVTFDAATQIFNYISTSRDPKVRLRPTKTYTGKQASTYIASFSSRGPNSLSPAVLKPDIAAPGVDILGAYIPNDLSTKGFKFDSGTSMAAPHVAGIVALLKAFHPSWSPAAIKSALVTTAWTTDPYSREPIFARGPIPKIADPFDFGGGIANPNGARHPGLVYDMSTQDYVLYLCAVGYGETAVDQLVGKRNSCGGKPAPSVLDLNLPSITVPNLKGSVTLTRTVTNVGDPNSKYDVVIDPPHGTVVKVNPTYLQFDPKVKKMRFTVTITTMHEITTEYYFGSLTWADGIHQVKIPISVKTEFPEVY